MIKIVDFNSLESSGLGYGGHGGSKKGVIINNEKWFLKYPKSTKSMDVQGLSYSTTPISEYLGSHIYTSLGFDTHETMLGYANGKIVVACKDFLSVSETIVDYNAMKNEYDEDLEEKLEKLSSSSSNENNDLEEILLVMENNPYFKVIPELKERFWDMFVVDTFLSNNDRNEGNWGIVVDKNTKKIRLAPIFDNGASFYNKASNEKLESVLNDEFKFKQVAYDSSVSIFEKNGKPINPLKFIEKCENEECNRALMRIVPKIDMDKIEKIFNDIPEEYNGIQVLSKVQKELYLKTLYYRYENIFLPIYEKLQNKV